MRSRCCVCVCVCLCIPLSLLGNGLVNVSLSLLVKGSVKIRTTSSVYYEITLLSVCVHILVSFSTRSVSYQRNAGD
jgi:hypothetical protein